MIVRDIEAETLGLGCLQDLIDQAVEHFLPRWHFLAAHLQKLGTMLDIEVRDRLAIDKRHDLLRSRG